MYYPKEQSQACGLAYNHERGIDYDKSFIAMAHIEVIRMLIAFAAHIEFKLCQMDVKSAFL